jgi:hypothetical protein
MWWVVKKILTFLIAFFVLFFLLAVIILMVCYSIGFDPYKINGVMKATWFLTAAFGAKKVAEKFS